MDQGTKRSKSTLTILTRLAQRRPEASLLLRGAMDGRLSRLAPTAIAVARETGSPIGKVLAEALRDAQDPHLSAELYDALTQDSVALRETAVVVARQIMDRAVVHLGTSGLVEKEPQLWTNLAGLLLRAGQAQEARDTCAEALDHFRGYNGWTEAQRGHFMAAALDCLGAAERAMANFPAAAAAAREARDIFAQLVEAGEEDRLADLARAASNLAGHLSGLGQAEDAYQASSQAVACYRRLVTRRSDALAQEFLTALIVFTTLAANLKHFDQAEETAHEAFEFVRPMAARDADRFQPTLAFAHNNLATVQSAREQHEEATQNLAAASQILRQLAKDQPNSYGSQMLQVERNLMVELAKCGKLRDACFPLFHSLRWIRRLGKAHTPIETKAWIELLHLLGTTLEQIGRPKSARGIFALAVVSCDKVIADHSAELASFAAETRKALAEALGRHP